MRFALFHAAAGSDSPAGGMGERAAGASPRHPDLPPNACGGDARLNMLLTFGGWQQDSWADRLPQLLSPFGVHSLRANSAREAAEIIRHNPVHIAIVDLRLPFDSTPGAPANGLRPADEGGARILDLLSRLETPPPTVVVKRGRSSRDDARDLADALRAGVYAAVDPPVHLEDLLRVMQRMLGRYYGGCWPASPRPT